MLPRNHSDLDMSLDGSIDFNSSHGSYKFDEDGACFGGGRSPLSWLKGWNHEEKKIIDINRCSFESLSFKPEKSQKLNKNLSNLSSNLNIENINISNDTISTSASTTILGEDLNKPLPKSNPTLAGSNSATTLNSLNSNEARIVAPYVSKISPYSAVEVRLQSTTDLVSILCSVDVLKMRSTFFYDLLSEQDHVRNLQRRSSVTNNKSNASNNKNSSSKNNCNDDLLNKMWRDPIILPESSPYEAAALLESLHEGRYVMVMPPPSAISSSPGTIDEYLLGTSKNNTIDNSVPSAAPISSSLYGNEWCFTWVRLAVAWGMTDLMQSFAYLIDHHFDRIVNILRKWHWRCNPSILSGLKIAIIKKNKCLIPSIVTGTIVESPAGTVNYSKVKVRFDPNQEVSREGFGSTKSNGSVSIAHIMNFNNQEMKTLLRNRSGMINYNPNTSFTNVHKNSRQNSKRDDDYDDILREENEEDENNIGDISEPFLVQATLKNSNQLASNNTPIGGNNSASSGNLSQQWIDPDELFMITHGNLLNIADKRMFWEMVNVLCEFKEIQSRCHSPLAQYNVLSDTIKRKEFKILWTQEGVDLMPKKLALDFIKSIYVNC